MIAFLAFVAGYRKSSITESIDELLAYFSEPESPKAQAPYVEIENPDPEVNAPPVKFNQTTAPNPYADLLKKQQEQQTAGAENSSGGYWMNSRKIHSAAHSAQSSKRKFKTDKPSSAIFISKSYLNK